MIILFAHWRIRFRQPWAKPRRIQAHKDKHSFPICQIPPRSGTIRLFPRLMLMLNLAIRQKWINFACCIVCKRYFAAALSDCGSGRPLN